MNAVTTLKNAESRMVNAIAAVTAEVDAIGTSSLDGALANLEAAVARARGRLDAALAFMGAKLGELTQTCEEMAASIEEDVAAATMPSNPVPVPQDGPAAVEPVSAPSALTTRQSDTQEPEKGRMTAHGAHAPSVPTPVGTEHGAVPVNRVAAALAEPSTNGTGRGHSGAKKGRRGGKGQK